MRRTGGKNVFELVLHTFHCSKTASRWNQFIANQLFLSVIYCSFQRIDPNKKLSSLFGQGARWLSRQWSGSPVKIMLYISVLAKLSISSNLATAWPDIIFRSCLDAVMGGFDLCWMLSYCLLMRMTYILTDGRKRWPLGKQTTDTKCDPWNLLPASTYRSIFRSQTAWSICSAGPKAHQYHVYLLTKLYIHSRYLNFVCNCSKVGGVGGGGGRGGDLS